MLLLMELLLISNHTKFLFGKKTPQTTNQATDIHSLGLIILPMD